MSIIWSISNIFISSTLVPPSANTMTHCTKRQAFWVWFPAPALNGWISHLNSWMVWLLFTFTQMLCFQSSAMQTAGPVWGVQITVRSARTPKPSFILAGVCLSVQPDSLPMATSVQVGVCSSRCERSQRKRFKMREYLQMCVCGWISSEPDLKASAPRQL